MKSNLIISVLLVSTCLYSCQSEEKQTGETYVIPVRSLLKESNEISLKDDIEKIRYIPLETNDQCLISNAFTVEMDKNKEYMFIYNGKTDQVFQFDKSGKFSYISKFHIIISCKLIVYIVMCFYQETN